MRLSTFFLLARPPPGRPGRPVGLTSAPVGFQSLDTGGVLFFSEMREEQASAVAERPAPFVGKEREPVTAIHETTAGCRRFPLLQLPVALVFLRCSSPPKAGSSLRRRRPARRLEGRRYEGLAFLERCVIFVLSVKRSLDAMSSVVSSAHICVLLPRSNFMSG